jgi:hypothetical protein
MTNPAGESESGSIRLDRSRRLHRHEVFDGHAFKSNRREDCVQMPRKMDTSRCSTAVWAPGTAPAVGMAPRYCGKAGKA